METSGTAESKRALRCELCDMFLIINPEDFVENFICAKCDKIRELQEKLLEMHTKLRQSTELSTILKETSKLQDTFNATVLIGSAGMGAQSSALLARTSTTFV